MKDTAQPRANPYVGPRAFHRGETLYGRQREVMELVDLLIAERVVLLHSPSGAGKTSLIHAALLPELEKEGFHVLPPMRVSQDPPNSSDPSAPSIHNRYVLSLLMSLEEALPEEEQTPLPELMGLTFEEYMDARHGSSEDGNVVLIFDQFEEILTVDPTDREAKVDFFDQVGAALHDRGLWALFSMRDEFLASLNPYLRSIPTRLSNTYRLELLGPKAALQAIQQPARRQGVEFTAAAAKKLVDDLRRVQVQRPDGSAEQQMGLHVEPVQLQVVCRRLWDELPEDAAQIVESDVEAVGDVDSALGGYYSDRVVSIAEEQGISERTIRNWFEHQLITEQGIRGQVLQGPEQSQGLDNEAIWALVDTHLVRAEKRRGATWFELAHDRLIRPVQTENAAWRRLHLSPLQRQAVLWQDENRQEGLLLRGEALDDAEAWAEAHEEELTELEIEFLRACQDARADADRRRARRIRRIAIGTTLFSIVAVVLAVVASLARIDAVEAQKVAETDRQTAVAAQFEAVSGQQTAIVAQSEAVSGRETAVVAQQEAEAAKQTAIAGEATAVTDRMIAQNAAQSLESNLQAMRTALAPTATPTSTPTSMPAPPPSPTPPSLPTSVGGAEVPLFPETPGSEPTETATPEPTPVPPTPTRVPPTPTPNVLADSIRDFGSSQGAEGWKYLVEEGRFSGRWQNMRFGDYAGNPCWLSTTGESYVRICADGEIHPGVTTRAAYEWRSTVDRQVEIREDAHKIDTGCGDGIRITTLRINEANGSVETLGDYRIPFDDATGGIETYRTRVTPTILIYVIVDINSDAACDASHLEIEID
jgi:hypothetical protein